MDLNAPAEVVLECSTVSCSACRLCLRRNKPGEPLIVTMVVNNTTPVFRFYCPDCYRRLVQAAAEDFVFPSLEEVLRGRVCVPMPLYLIKNGDPLKLFFPKDKIELGLLRQRSG